MTYLPDSNWIKKPYLNRKENHRSKTPSFFKQGAINYPKIRNSFFLILILLACSQVGFGQAVGDYRSKAPGNWTETTTWEKYTGTSWVDGGYPSLGTTNVTIQIGHTVTLNSSITVNNTNIDGTLIGGSGTLNVKGDFINNGTFTANTSKIVMKGTIVQDISSGSGITTTFATLTIDNTSKAVTASNSFEVGTFNINLGAIFQPAASVVITGSGSLTGSGTVRVTRVSTGSADYLSQYIFTNKPIAIVEYFGTLPQVISIFDGYYTLVINNINGCTLNGSAICSTALTILKGVLSVASGATLNVKGTTNLNYRAPLPSSYPKQIDYWSCLVLQSDSTPKTGSFIHSDSFSGPGTVKVERYMSHSDNWHLYSSPINNQSIHDFLKYNPEIPDLFDNSVTPPYQGVGMRNYDTASDTWNYYFDYPTTSTLEGSIGGGKGFTVRTYNDTPTGKTGRVDATGIPNPNDGTIELSTSGNSWNCIGNPFTSAMYISAFLNTNTSSLDQSFKFVYLWDNDASDYVIERAQVQLGQGFFVKAIDVSASYDGDMANANSGLLFKAATLNWPSIKILAQNINSKTTTKVEFETNATKGLDPGYDGGLLTAHPDFSIYSRLLEDNGVNFMLQCLPDQNYDQYVIPLGLDCKVGGDITFTAEVVNLPSGCQALLEDRTTKRFTRLDLKDAKYTATVSANTKGTGRFFLHTSDVISGDKPIQKEQFKISKIGKTLYINGEVSDMANFYVYSMNGKQLANFKAESQVQNQFDASRLPAGVYILTVDDKNKRESVKFVIEK